jgi:hypothetical protein
MFAIANNVRQAIKAQRIVVFRFLPNVKGPLGLYMLTDRDSAGGKWENGNPRTVAERVSYDDVDCRMGRFL